MKIQTTEVNDSTDRLAQVIWEKKCKVKEYKDAINSHITIKQELLHKSNSWKMKPETIKQELGLSKLPTEKQVQAFIDEKYSDLTDELAISKENINLIKKDIEILNDEINLFTYKVMMELDQE